MQVPFQSLAEAHQCLKSEIVAFFETFYDSNRFILDARVQCFEEEWAEYCQARYCVGVGCGLDALSLALKALGIGSGDEVIVPSNAYIASWIAVTQVGAKVVPVEPVRDTFNLDPSLVEGAITTRTRAILPVHLFGQPCEMGEIGTVARSHGLAVVEDNAQAHGAACDGRKTGGLGTVNAHSFYPTKNLGALGDAGAVTTDDPRLADRVRTLRNYGFSKKNYSASIGVNSRLDELQAGILSIKLRYLDRWNDERRGIASWYREQLQDIEGLALPATSSHVRHAYHLHVVRTNLRDPLERYLADRGIGTAIHYPVPPHLQPAYGHLGLRRGDLPIAEELADTSLSLPLYIGMTEDQVRAVSSAIRGFFSQAGKKRL